jgi:hypothetical protein
MAGLFRRFSYDLTGSCGGASIRARSFLSRTLPENREFTVKIRDSGLDQGNSAVILTVLVRAYRELRGFSLFSDQLRKIFGYQSKNRKNREVT